MVRNTLPGHDYTEQSVFEVEKSTVFARSWFYAGLDQQVADAGQWITVDVAGESVIILRAGDGGLRAFFNVCRHRGSQICDGTAGRAEGVLMCPYHAWCYDFDGALVATPRVGQEEVDRSQLSLHPVHVEEWQGFLFVNLDRSTPMPLREWLAGQRDEPLNLERFDLGQLRLAVTTEAIVNANWKIIIENYCECLHCPTVHPELMDTVKAYRTGWVQEEGRDDGGVTLPPGGNSYSPLGLSTLTVMPTMNEVEANSIYGAMVFPNMFIDMAGTGLIASQLLPLGPHRTKVIAHYLFVADDVVRDDFDPSPVVDFSELVARQDFEVCERVQRGVSSSAFGQGVLAVKDEAVDVFVHRYLEARDGAR
jgi:Rieske 2Fe-2S family protein